MKKKVLVSYLVEVTLDETKFTKEFMEEYDHFITESNLDDHIRQIGYLGSQEIITYNGNNFVEGYGIISEMGISAEILDVDMEIT